MNATLVPLDTLGATIRAHIEKGDASIEKADQHYKSAGLYLAEAKERVKQTSDLTWPQFLADHCNIRRARADELIMIADGRITLPELRMRKAESVRAVRQRQKEGLPLRSSKLLQVEDLADTGLQNDSISPSSEEVLLLRRKLENAEKTAADNAALASMREVRANEAEAQRDQAQHQALFYKSDKEHLAAELDAAREEIATLRHLVMNGGSREGLLDEHGDEIGGRIFVISACEDATRTCMMIEPFWPFPEDLSKMRRFLGWNRAEWKAAPIEMRKALQMDEAAVLWEAEWNRALQPHHEEADWPENPIECLEERYRRAALACDPENFFVPATLNSVGEGGISDDQVV